MEKEHEPDPLLEFLDRMLGHGSSKVKGAYRISASVSELAGGCSGDIDSVNANLKM